jgi:hypothetical protein
MGLICYLNPNRTRIREASAPQRPGECTVWEGRYAGPDGRPFALMVDPSAPPAVRADYGLCLEPFAPPSTDNPRIAPFPLDEEEWRRHSACLKGPALRP